MFDKLMQDLTDIDDEVGEEHKRPLWRRFGVNIEDLQDGIDKREQNVSFLKKKIAKYGKELERQQEEIQKLERRIDELRQSNKGI